VRIRLLIRSAALLPTLTLLPFGVAWAQTGSSGARVMGTNVLTDLPRGPLCWRLDVHAARAAAEAARGVRGTVAESFLHHSSQPWKVPADGWRPKGLCAG
jgi:hypothetical protein